MSSTKAVFFDPDKKRWPRIRLSVVIVISVISLILGLLAFSIISAPVLSSLQLGQAAQIFGKGNHPVRQALLGQYNQRLARTKLALAREIRHSNQIKTLAPRNSSTKTIGYYVNWDPSSLNSLATNINSLDVVIGEWLHLSGSDGSVVIDTSGSYTAALDLIHKRKPDLQVFALINNFENNSWNAKALSTMLASETARQKNITSIIQFVKNNNLTGVNIDFEEVGLESQANLNKYMQELHNACAKENLLVSINLPADDDNFNYKLLSANSDYVILMLYDEHWATGLPGPISSLQWYASIVAKRAPEIGANKLIIGLGNYGYDWAAGQPAVNLTYEEAILSARDSQADISLEPTSLNPYFSYDDEVGVHHDVWFLDATSVYNEIIMAKNIKPFGFSVWRLGSEDPSIWPLLEQDENLNQTSLTPLESIAFGYDVDYQGQGEVLKVVSKPQEGKRSFSYDAQQNLIVNEKYVSFPSPYVIQRYGQANKKIALTFDDGPDPQYTPQILDILKQYNVKASFFIIGQNGDANPELLERIYDEGHDIGNHTYTHPNIAHISLRQLALETSATERLLEATINHQSHLFRSPYAEDSEPDTADQVQPVEFLNNLGYLDVGMQIDPSDWKKPGVDQIVQAVVAGALKNNGNIVLLHDAGGDRSQTIAALPQIITQLQAKGYTFTTVSGLLGKTRDEVMPPVAASSMWKNWANLAGFSFLRYADSVIHYIFLIGIILGLLRILFIIIFAIKQKVTKISKEKFHGTVAVIVAAYNESKVINRTIASLLAAEPKNFEIIVVDDGSSDNTYELVKNEFGHEPRVSVFKKENGGKASAINVGLEKTKADIIVTLDADTIFSQDTIEVLLNHFSDPKVGAVAGNTKVGNRINLLTRLQALEYITSQNLDRRAFAVMNMITVVPGAVGAWRRVAVIEAGGFSTDTLAEDADLTMTIREHGYEITYEENAYALTEAPDTMKSFIRQRHRWMFGTFQAAWKHNYILFKKKYGWFGFFALPNIFIFQILFPLIAPLMDIVTVVVVILAWLGKLQHPAEYSFDAMWAVLFYYALFIVVDYLSALIAFFMEQKENKRLLVWLLVQRLYYRQLMYIVAIKSFISSLRGWEVGWGKLERKGTVKFN